MSERLAAKDPRRVGWNHVRIDRYGILWSDDVSQEYCSWQGIVDIIADEDAIWLKVHEIKGFYLPPRLFAEEGSYEECVLKIKLFRNEAKPPAHIFSVGEPAIH